MDLNSQTQLLQLDYIIAIHYIIIAIIIGFLNG